MLVLDLVKQTERREREVIVGREYRRAVEHVNSTMPPVSTPSFLFPPACPSSTLLSSTLLCVLWQHRPEYGEILSCFYIPTCG